jgi:hypothetical protein
MEPVFGRTIRLALFYVEDGAMQLQVVVVSLKGGVHSAAVGDCGGLS